MLRRRNGDEDNEEELHIIMSWQEKAAIASSKLYLKNVPPESCHGCVKHFKNVTSWRTLDLLFMLLNGKYAVKQIPPADNMNIHTVLFSGV
jgi:hypothetical protein